MDRLPLIISTLCFLFGFAATVASLKAGHFRPRRFNLAMMGAGFLLQTVFLVTRGKAIGHCPLTNLFEALIFLSWAITLFYLLIGPVYRLSLLGMFTEPLVFLIQVVALLAPVDAGHPVVFPPHSPWLEFHAAVSVIAYGAFAMAGVAGIMYLAQERQLKTRRLGVIFFQMPPITDLATTNVRLLWVGWLLLTLGQVSAAAIRVRVGLGVLVWGGAMWLSYLLLLLACRRLGPRRVGIFSVALFALSVIALCVLNHFSKGVM
ncbi:MAG: cytochrome c biogenesis protein CcsA [Verrucomicrobia bacterium]|nr:cytochrome c biogenesis protein CcsA [Verrucomicrobiota bacterium]